MRLTVTVGEKEPEGERVGAALREVEPEMLGLLLFAPDAELEREVEMVPELQCEALAEGLVLSEGVSLPEAVREALPQMDVVTLPEDGKLPLACEGEALPENGKLPLAFEGEALLEGWALEVAVWEEATLPEGEMLSDFPLERETLPVADISCEKLPESVRRAEMLPEPMSEALPEDVAG